MLQALRRATATPAATARGKTTLTAKLKAPLLLELGLTHELAHEARGLASEIDELLRELYAPNGIVFLLDEGDLMRSDEFEDYLLSPIAEANSNDVPVTIATSGTSIAYLRSVTGQTLSYSPRLIPPLMLPRLDVESSSSLLIETAALGGQEWQAEWTRPLAEVSRGVPRAIHSLGRQMFREIALGTPPDRASARAAERYLAELTHVQHALLNEVWPDARAVSDWAPASADWYDLVQRLSAHGGHSFDESQRRLDRVLTSGVIEVDAQWRVSLVEPLT
jgi:hypothetical protein